MTVDIRYNRCGGIEDMPKTFYIETFGCQMNAHDSEKVIGTLVGQGYAQVATPDEAELVFYNTCSIRDKAEQKVFHRLQQFKRDGKGKTFAVLGCVAQQEGEKIFEKAPHVSMVCGSASYNQLPQMLVQLEAGNRRVTGLSLDTDETFETPMTRRDNPHRAYITIIEGCDKKCAYCVVGIRRVRFTTSHPRDFVKPIINAIDANPSLCNHVHLPVQSGSTRMLEAMQRLYTREEYMQRIAWMKAASRPIAITT